MQLRFDGLEFPVENINLVLQLADLGLDLNAGSCLLQGTLKLVDFVVETSLLTLVDIASS